MIYDDTSAISQYETGFHPGVPSRIRQRNYRHRARLPVAKTTAGLERTLAHPVEVSLLQQGKWIGYGKIWQVALDEVWVETDVDLAEDSYLQVELQLPGQGKKQQLWGRIIQCTDQGVVLIMDVLHPATLVGLRALMEINP